MTKEKNTPAYLTVEGVRFVVIPESEYEALTATASRTGQVPLPLADANGNFPARETIRAMLANKLRERRQALGLSQAQLAELAGVRIETVNRLESAKQRRTPKRSRGSRMRWTGPAAERSQSATLQGVAQNQPSPHGQRHRAAQQGSVFNAQKTTVSRAQGQQPGHSSE